MNRTDKALFLTGLVMMAFGLVRFANFQGPVWLLQSALGMVLVGFLMFKRLRQ